MTERVLGPTGSPRRRWTLLLPAIMVLAAAVVFGVTAAVGASLPGSNFEIDTSANLKVDGAASDWASVVEIRKADLASGSGDDSFGQGAKEDSEVPSVVDGSIPPNKSDLLNFGVYLETTGSGARFLNLFWHRVQEPSGTTNMDFEFNQSSTLSANGVTPVRMGGDLLIQYDLAQGGTNPILFKSEWIDSGAASQCEASNSVPCWGTKTNLTTAGGAIGSINTSAIASADADGLGAISARTFGEAQLDFDALTGGATTCTSFGSAYLKSRSSDSFTSALKDFIAPTRTNLSNCGSVIIRKQTDPDENPNTTSFGYTKAFTTAPASAITFTLTDDGVQSYTNVLFGTGYTVDEDVIPAGWDLASINCNVAANPSVGVTPVTSVANGTVTFAIDAASDVLDCTYTNRARGTIIVEKQTDPDGATGSFAFTGTAAGTISDNGQIAVADLAPGQYTSTETNPAPAFDLTSISCDDANSSGSVATRTATFNLEAGETVKCTFNNRKRARIDVHKQDDAGTPNALQGAVFTLFTDNAPLGGNPPHGAEDLTTGLTCTTNASGNCSFTNVVPGQYWVVETTGVMGFDLAPDQNVTVGAGATASLTFTDPRKFKIIVVVCKEQSNTLHASTITVDSEDKTSLGPSGGGALTDAQVCGIGGASYAGKHKGNHPANVNIPNP